MLEADGRIHRFLSVDSPDRTLLNVADEFAISGSEWTIGVEPRPCLEWAPWSLADVHDWTQAMKGRPLTLERFGVLHGSTLRLIQSGYQRR